MAKKKPRQPPAKRTAIMADMAHLNGVVDDYRLKTMALESVLLGVCEIMRHVTVDTINPRTGEVVRRMMDILVPDDEEE